ELIQQTISRGKLSVSIHISETEEDNLDIAIDEEKIKTYSKILNRIRDVAAITEPLRIQDILQFSDIFVQKEVSPEKLSLKWTLIQKALEQAVQALMEMRKREGSLLEKDLLSRIQLIEHSLLTISESSAGRNTDIRNKMMERVNLLIEDDRIDRDRLELEVIVL